MENNKKPDALHESEAFTANFDAANGNVYKHYSYKQTKRAGNAMGFDIP